MADRENREDWRRECSLLALAQGLRGEEDEDTSPVSIGDRSNPSWRKDAATRHRLARLQREGRSNPLLAVAAPLVGVAGAERFGLVPTLLSVVRRIIARKEGPTETHPVEPASPVIVASPKPMHEAVGYPQRQPYTGQLPYPKDPLAGVPQVPSAADQHTQIDEIRASLREFHEAIRELAESRSQRRYF